MRSRVLGIVALVLVAGVALWAALPSHYAGEASLDLSVYADTAANTRPIAEVVKPAAQRPASKPNFIVILADDLGYGDVGPNGNTLIRTPSLDRIAQMGARF